MSHPEYRRSSTRRRAKTRADAGVSSNPGAEPATYSQTRPATVCPHWPDAPGTPYQNLCALHAPSDLAVIAPIQQQLATDELSAFYILMKGRALKRSRERAKADRNRPSCCTAQYKSWI